MVDFKDRFKRAVSPHGRTEPPASFFDNLRLMLGKIVAVQEDTTGRYVVKAVEITSKGTGELIGQGSWIPFGGSQVLSAMDPPMPGQYVRILYEGVSARLYHAERIEIIGSTLSGHRDVKRRGPSRLLSAKKGSL